MRIYYFLQSVTRRRRRTTTTTTTFKLIERDARVEKEVGRQHNTKLNRTEQHKKYLKRRCLLVVAGQKSLHDKEKGQKRRKLYQKGIDLLNLLYPDVVATCL